MQLKKSPKASLEDKKLTYVLMGLVLVLSICYVAFEWTEKEVTKYEVTDTDFFFEEEIDIQQTSQETPPPPPPPAVQEVEVLNVVEDDVEVEEIEINTEDDKDVEVVIAPPVEAPVEEEEEEVIFMVVESMSEGGAVAEYLTGYEAYKLLSEIISDEEKKKALTDSISALLTRLISRDRLTISIAGETPSGFAERLIDSIPDNNSPAEKKTTPLVSEGDEYILLPSKVAYAVAGGYSESAKDHLGLLRVARSILSYEYLWNKVRVKNGAYGTGFTPKRGGLISFYSYRDPNPGASLGYYRESADYLRALADSGEDVTKFVIGAYGEYDMITTPRMAAMIATRNYLSGWSESDEARVLHEMLSVKTDDLRLAADIIDEALKNEKRAIVGGQEQLSTLGYKPKTIIKI